MRHVVLFLALGICSAQTAPLTRATTDPERDVRRPDFTVEPGSPVISLTYSADGNTLTSEDAKYGVALWDVKNGQPVRKAGRGETPAAGAIAAFSPDGAQAASVAGVAIYVRENRTGRLLATLLAQTGEIRTLVFNPSGRTIASAGDDGAIRLWTMPRPQLGEEDLRKIEAAIPSAAAATPKRPRRVLVFWRADAIQRKAGVRRKQNDRVARAPDWRVPGGFSRDYYVLDPRILARYDAIIMNSTAHLGFRTMGRRRRC